LLKNKLGYQSQKVLCLYEDILFIWAYKKAEAGLRKNKREETDKLLKELEEATKKKAITIK
jgi:hypothetical protein